MRAQRTGPHRRGEWPGRKTGRVYRPPRQPLAAAYPSFTPKLKREVADALHGSGRLGKADYDAVMRDALEAGYVVDWPTATDDVGSERTGCSAS